MKVTISFQIDDKTADLIVRNSIERVVNTSVALIENYTINHSDERVDENLHDWQFCKQPVVHLWDAMRDGVFRARNGDMKQVSNWIV